MSCETSLNLTYNIPKDETTPDANSENDTGASIELSLDEEGNTETPAHFEIDKETGKEVWIEAKVKSSFVFGDTAYLKVLRTDIVTPYEMAKSFGGIKFVGSNFQYLQAETIEFTNSKEAELGKEPVDGLVQWKWNGISGGTVTFTGKKIALTNIVKAGILECTYKVKGDRWALTCPQPSLPELTEQPVKVVAIQGKLNASTTVNFVSPEKKEEEKKQAEKDKTTPSYTSSIEISLDETLNLEADESTITKGTGNPNIPPGYKEKTQFGIPDTAYLKVISMSYIEEEWGIAKDKSALISNDKTLAETKMVLGDSLVIVSTTPGVSAKEVVYKWSFSDGSYILCAFTGGLNETDTLKLKSSEVVKRYKFDSKAAAYKVESGFGKLAQVSSGCTYKVDEYLVFARETSKKLKYPTSNITRWQWESEKPGVISMTPQFNNGTVTLSAPVIGTLLVSYIINYDRWSLTVSQSVGDLGEPEASGGKAMEVPVVAYQDTAQSSVNVSFQKKAIDEPKLKVLQAIDCKTGQGIPGAVITFKGTSYIMDDKGERNVGLVPKGTYAVTGYAAGYLQTTKEVQVS